MGYPNDRGLLNRHDSFSYKSEKGSFKITVEKVLNSWMVSVIRTEDEKVISDDYFTKRWEAIARAEDFLQLCNRKEQLLEKEG